MWNFAAFCSGIVYGVAALLWDGLLDHFLAYMLRLTLKTLASFV